MIVGGANPDTRVRISAPTAWPDCLTPSIAPLISRNRATGSAGPTGSVTHMAATRLPRAPRSTSARIDTGTIALSPTSSVGSSVEAHVVAERAGHSGQHDVVDGAPERVLDRLEPPEVGSHPGEPPVRTDPHVERARRGGLKPRPRQRADARERSAGPLGHGPRASERRSHATHHLGGNRRPLDQGVGQQLRAAREWARDPLVVGRCHRQGLRRRVEQDRRDIDPGDPVHQSVVRLGQDRKALPRRGPRPATAPTAAGSGRAPGRTRGRRAA